ncbi:outer membrane protein [Sphaerochaeta pleomorpha str. Grapes]|uniref:Outer membrane protein n=1 Tax=Sphaerochaeta pleomorpha (strain ATCC BAA-1885 / DSM 22778 / Grapes) TaxID=158190 RepID=G8QSE6_SPHPG|nr:TolC family protein [Sphaerochaeta pleomorpha]AEV30076.1 outer membrane protein [Sphaerochaeta pleomorpha str. Grapes]
MRKFSMALTLVLCMCLGSVYSLDMTVDEAVNRALASNQSLQSSALDVQMAKDASEVSWNGFLPTVQASSTLSRSNEVSSIAKMFDPTASVTTAFVGNLSFSFNFNPALITNMELSRQKYLAGQITYEQAKAETVLNVKKLFYAILLQQQSLALQQETLANTEARMEQAQNLYAQGYATELTVLQAQVGYENLKAMTLKSEQAVAQQLANFAFLLHLDGEEPLHLVGEIEPEFKTVDLQQCLARIGARYDIAGLLKQKDILLVQREAIDRQIWIPSVSIGFSLQPVHSNITDSWFDSNNWSDSGSSSMTVAWNLTNLLPWSAGRQNAKVLENNVKKMDLQLSMLKESAQLQIKNLIISLAQAEQAIESSERSISLAKKSYEMTVSAYGSGVRELLDVRDSESQLNQARLGKLSEQYNYLTALLDLEYATQIIF